MSQDEPNNLTHAYVGYRADGTACMVLVDDTSTPAAAKMTAKDCAGVIRKGGRVERVTIEAARQIKLSYRKAGT